MNEYTEGAIVRCTATFSENVDTDVYFRLTGEGIDKHTTRYGTAAEGMTITLDSPKVCHVDIDTYGYGGVYQYYFYSRGTYKAGAKSSFRII